MFSGFFTIKRPGRLLKIQRHRLIKKTILYETKVVDIKSIRCLVNKKWENIWVTMKVNEPCAKGIPYVVERIETVVLYRVKAPLIGRRAATETSVRKKRLIPGVTRSRAGPRGFSDDA